MSTDLQTWCERAFELGADRAAIIPAGSVVVAEWVRMKCLFGCDEPGLARTCPPNGAPSVEQTQRVLDGYEAAILLGVGPIVGEECSDAESRRLNDAALALERALFLAGFHKAWTMGAGPCDLCACCRAGDPCPTPESARPSMEACGVDVFTTVRAAGWEIETVRAKDDEYRYFALVLVR